jgi:arylsulfatase A-like enzyme
MFGTWHIEPPPLESGFDVFSPPTRAEVAQANAIEWIKTQANSESPFFAMVGFFETHRPFCGTDAQREAAKAMDKSKLKVPGYLPDADLTREDLAEFHQSVKVADQNTDRLLDALDAAGMTGNTLFLFTVDHGIPFPRAKGTLYDPGIKAALLIRWPGKVAPGSTCETFTSNIDILPTLLEIVGRPIPENVQGRSFLPLLTGEDRPGFMPRHEIFAEKTYHEVYDPIRCIRTERYKYIRNFAERPRLLLPTDIHNSPTRRALDDEYLAHRPTHELYNLNADALEQHNLNGHPDYVDVQRELDAQLSAWMEATNDPLRHGPIPRRRPPGS